MEQEVMMVMTTRWSSAQLGKEEREKQNPLEIKGISKGFGFGDQDTIEGVIMFRIDSRTIKRGVLRLSGYRVPVGVIVHEMHLEPSELT